jgi:hypothetical protein
MSACANYFTNTTSIMYVKLLKEHVTYNEKFMKKREVAGPIINQGSPTVYAGPSHVNSAELKP